MASKESGRSDEEVAGEEGKEKELGMSSLLMPCTGRRVAEEEVQVSKLSTGGGRASPVRGRSGQETAGKGGPEKGLGVAGSRTPAEGDEEGAVSKLSRCRGRDGPAAKKHDAAGAKRKAEAEKGSAVSSEAGMADVSAGHSEDKASSVKWVELPSKHVRWIMAQKRENHPIPSIEDYELYGSNSPMEKIIDANKERFSRLSVSLKESRDEFFQYQDWVRKVFERNHRVMVPDSVLEPRPELQEEINDLWAQFSEEYDREHPNCDSEDEEDCPMDPDQDANQDQASN